MTDELAIQAVNPQVKRKDNTMPYALGGAAIGAVAGGLSPIGVTKPKYSSYEDILKESNDTLEKNINKGGDNKSFWETAKQHKEAVDKAGEEWEAKVKEIKESHKTAAGELPADNEAAKKLKSAQEAYDNELKNLVETEKKKLGRGTVADITTKDIKAFDKITTEQLPTEYAFGKLKGKKIPGNQVEALYNTLTGNLRNAEASLEATLNAGLRADKANYSTKIAQSFNAAIHDTAGMSDDKVVEYFNNKTTWSILGGSKPTAQYQRAIDVAKQYYPDITKLSDEQILSIGRDLNPGEKVSSGMKTTVVTVKDAATGRNVTKTVIFEEKAYDELLKAEKERIANLRTNAADQIFAETQKAVAIDRELKAFDGTFEKSIKGNLAQQTGLYNTATDTLDLAKIKTEGALGYADDIKALDAAKKAGSTTLPAGLKGNYGTATVEEALTQAQARQSVYNNYTRQNKAIQNRLANCVRNNAIIQEFDNKIADAIANDKAVLRARQQLAEQFPGVYSAKSTLSADEIATKAEEAAKKAIEGKKAATDLKAAKEAAEKEAEKLGLKAKDLTQEELEKILKDKGLAVNKEEALAKTKTAAKEALEKDLSRIKGPNRWVNAAIAAVVLGLGGYALASSKKS